MIVPGAQHWLLVQSLESETAYQFSVLAQNKLGTGPFSEVVTVNTLGTDVHLFTLAFGIPMSLGWVSDLGQLPHS